MKRQPLSNLRVTGGIYRGRRVRCPPGIIRPTMDRMRESLFSILGNLEGISFLDLFCGSGIVGIEAASRGAEPVLLVESDRLKRPTITTNIHFVESSIALKVMTAEHFIAHTNNTFEIIYLDPPFSYPNKLKLMQSIERKAALTPPGMLILHYPQEEVIPESIGSLRVFDARAYGRSRLLFFRYS